MSKPITISKQCMIGFTLLMIGSLSGCLIDGKPPCVGNECKAQCVTNSDCSPDQICGQDKSCIPRISHCSDHSHCASGELCNVATGGCQSVDELCTGDEQCGANQYCNASEVCLSGFSGSSGGGDSFAMPAVCQGFCVDEVTHCFSDGDCAKNEHCVFGGPVPMEDTDSSADTMMAPAGICEPKPALKQCHHDNDCDEGEVCDFGFSQSLPNALAPSMGECVPAPPQECMSDADCQDGYSCAFEDIALPEPAGDDAEEVPVFLPPETGICVKNPVLPTPCMSDSDCDDHEECVFAIFEGHDGAADMLPQGECMPKPPTDCTSDADCAPQEECVFEGATADPDGAFPDLPVAPQGTCQLKPAQECFVDDDCDEGEFCDMDMFGQSSDSGSGAPQADPAPPAGTCKPSPPQDCLADSDCDEGYICNLSEFEDSEEALAVLGTCEPQEPNECMVTGCSGQICAQEPVATDCQEQGWFKCLSLTTCGPVNGGCGWQPTDAFLECMDAFACPDGADCG